MTHMLFCFPLLCEMTESQRGSSWFAPGFWSWMRRIECWTWALSLRFAPWKFNRWSWREIPKGFIQLKGGPSVGFQWCVFEMRNSIDTYRYISIYISIHTVSYDSMFFIVFHCLTVPICSWKHGSLPIWVWNTAPPYHQVLDWQSWWERIASASGRLVSP